MDEPALEALKEQGRASLPVIALVYRNPIDASPEELEHVASPHLERARMLITWLTGEPPEPIAMAISTEHQTFFRVTPCQSRKRQRLGFGNAESDISGQLFRISKLAEQDERFAFALSMFRDALREQNPPFRAARLFSCLESLAYKIEGEAGSRKKVKKLLGLENGAITRVSDERNSYEYDRVEIAGRIRDKLFHGAPFKPSEHLTAEAAKAYQYLQKHPRELGDILLVDCELEFARWANGKSIGQSNSAPT
ncbi:hypothetical protein ACQKP5_01010 [Pseudomonas vancouverensis]|uniref:hypothetical protein n=1 Tax=Pseudomonas vancouverensis TaxID=95300 RepID=UPI003CFEC4E1